MSAYMGTLPPLREELSLHLGPTGRDGGPSWTIRDPVRNRFFRIGWAAFEMMSRWHLGDAEAIAQAVTQETTAHVEPDDVLELAAFLAGSQLTVPVGPAQRKRLADRAASSRQSVMTWLLHHYLFFRIPLVRPDKGLVATLSLVRWLGGAAFRWATGAALLAGLFLVGRRWDEFSATLVDTLTPSGMLAYGLALTLVKIVHELAHAYTARHFGCRVPAMGVAFLVMWPVLYTDVNEVWMLKSRNQRLWVGSAGILAELTVAAWATLAWAFLPDGALRQAAFVLAALSWISSLAINLSPFMRFDGYFLVMDALEVPNLHPRSFALARWWLREILFALGEPAPEPLPTGQRAALIVFAFAVWLYRLALFLGIALLVYHFFIKAVGILLFAVEIGWFVALPLIQEVREWLKRRQEITRNRRWRLAAALAGLSLLAAAIPWPTRIEAPCIIRAEQIGTLYLPLSGRLTQSLVQPGQPVTEGQVLYRFHSPDLDQRLAILSARLAGRESELETARLDLAYRERLSVLEGDIARLGAERDALLAETARLTLTAPHDGLFVDPPPALTPGEWVSPHLPLGSVRSTGRAIAIAYVAEHDLPRLRPSAEISLVPVNPDAPRLSGRLVSIAPAPTRLLPDAILAVPHGGPIQARPSQAGLVPDSSLTRVQIAVEAPAPHTVQPAIALIEADAVSPLARLLRSALIILVREWGT